MHSWGITLVVLGLLSFVLPLLGKQFRLVTLLGLTGMGTVAAGLVFLVAGALLLAKGRKSNSIYGQLTRGSSADAAIAVPKTPGIRESPSSEMTETSGTPDDEILDAALAAYNRGDYMTALGLLQPLADAGNERAQHNIAELHAFGKGVPQDHGEAAKWYRKAADQGLAAAQYSLGFLHSNGKGVPQSYVDAINWYRKAAEQGDAIAQYQLGSVHLNGDGAPQDYVEAGRLFRMAANQGHSGAQYCLGLPYRRGDGVPQDYVQAVKWYRMAAEQNFAAAQCNLGAMYENGGGVPQDHAVTSLSD